MLWAPAAKQRRLQTQPTRNGCPPMGGGFFLQFLAPARGAAAPRTPRCIPGGYCPPGPPRKAPPAQGAFGAAGGTFGAPEALFGGVRGAVAAP
eukprot:1260013-Alexandrium_andersonii.AAC.1